MAKLQPEEMRTLFERIRAFHKTFQYTPQTTSGWLAVLNKMGASFDEVKEAICDHAASEEGRFEPKVSNICHYVRKNRGIES